MMCTTPFAMGISGAMIRAVLLPDMTNVPVVLVKNLKGMPPAEVYVVSSKLVEYTTDPLMT